MDDEDKAGIKNLTLRLSEHLNKRLSNHIHLLKKFESSSHTKQRWIEEAVKEKLIEEEKNPDFIPKDKYVSFKVHPSLDKRIQKRIELMKKCLVSYSTKQWLLEAMYEKLDREEESAKKLLEKALQ